MQNEKHKEIIWLYSWPFGYVVGYRMLSDVVGCRVRCIELVDIECVLGDVSGVQILPL